MSKYEICLDKTIGGIQITFYVSLEKSHFSQEILDKISYKLNRSFQDLCSIALSKVPFCKIIAPYKEVTPVTHFIKETNHYKIVVFFIPRGMYNYQDPDTWSILAQIEDLIMIIFCDIQQGIDCLCN